MIKLYSHYNGVVRDITRVVKSLRISGDKAQAARKLDVTLAYPLWEQAQPRTQIGPGTKVWLLLDGKEIFRGVAWDREINSANEELTFVAFDYLIYLTKSKDTFNFVNTSPEDATREICSLLGVEAGNIASTGIRVNRLIAQKTGYEAIMELYTQASKINRKEYIPVMDGTKLCVIEKGKVIADYVLKSQVDGIGNNLVSSSYRDTLDGVVNNVKIFNENNAYVNQTSDYSSINRYGLLQETYTEESDKDSLVVARGMLAGVQRDVTVSALGNWACRTGYAVKTEIVYVSTLLDATVFIDGDTHTWEPGTGKYTMSLNVSFGNVMDSKE
jgi:hypothetical protein